MNKLERKRLTELATKVRKEVCYELSRLADDNRSGDIVEEQSLYNLADRAEKLADDLDNEARWS